MGKFIVRKAKNDGWYFDLKAGNGETIGRGQVYTERSSAMAGIDSVKENANSHVEDQTEKNPPHYPNPKYEVYLGNDGQFYFRLKARNGQNILASEGYTAKESCFKGINSVGENAPAAPVEVDE